MMRLHRRQLGVSLIEALVALAVMAIGMLGLVGVQSTLRGNADIAKQRSVATRIAQQEIESWRAFVTMATSTTVTAYSDIASTTPPGVAVVPPTGVTWNASYLLERTVANLAAPRVGKSLSVQVSWTDRTGQAQSVRLSTLIAGIEPEFAATLHVPGEGDVLRQPNGRMRAIPPTAKDLGNGTSGFKPPSVVASTVAWVFNNATGVITLCSTSAANTSLITTGNLSCTADNALLLSGFVRYSLNPAVIPSLSDLNWGPLGASSLQIQVAQVTPVVQSISCFTEAVSSPSRYTAYYCAVPVLTATPEWTGTLSFGPTGLMAATLADVSTSTYKSCRYAATGTYATPQKSSLANENYLFTLSGDGTSAFPCPAGTAAHQPV
jgi:Tfp pilus assembly protein PilV